MAEMSPLRRRMIEDMTVRNLSPATQQSYLNAVSKFSGPGSGRPEAHCSTPLNRQAKRRQHAFDMSFRAPSA